MDNDDDRFGAYTEVRTVRLYETIIDQIATFIAR